MLEFYCDAGGEPLLEIPFSLGLEFIQVCKTGPSCFAACCEQPNHSWEAWAVCMFNHIINKLMFIILILMVSITKESASWPFIDNTDRIILDNMDNFVQSEITLLYIRLDLRLD